MHAFKFTPKYLTIRRARTADYSGGQAHTLSVVAPLIYHVYMLSVVALLIYHVYMLSVVAP